jgi:competence protein ComEA
MNATQKKHRFTLALSLLASLLLGPSLHARAQAAVAPPKPGAVRPQASAAPATPNQVVDLNSAGLSELTKLPGIGPSRAKALLDLRTRMGGFKKVDDVMRVKGIGRKTFRRLEPMLRVGPQAPHAAPLPTK